MILRSATYNNLGVLFRAQGKLREAWYYVNKALKLDLLVSSVANGSIALTHQKRNTSRLLLESDAAISYLNLCAILSRMKRHQSAQVYAECALSVLSKRIKRISSLRITLDKAKPCKEAKIQNDDITGQSDSAGATRTFSAQHLATAKQICQASLLSTIRLMSAALHNLAVEYEHQGLYTAATRAYERASEFARYELPVGNSQSNDNVDENEEESGDSSGRGSRLNIKGLSELARMVERSCEQALRSATDEEAMRERASAEAKERARKLASSEDGGEDEDFGSARADHSTRGATSNANAHGPRIYLSPREAAAKFRSERAKTLPIQNDFAMLGDGDVSLAHALGDVSRLSGIPKPIKRALTQIKSTAPVSPRRHSNAFPAPPQPEAKWSSPEQQSLNNRPRPMTAGQAGFTQTRPVPPQRPERRGIITQTAVQFPQIALMAAQVCQNHGGKNSLAEAFQSSGGILSSHQIKTSFDAGDGLDGDDEDAAAAAIEEDIQNWSAWDPASSRRLAQESVKTTQDPALKKARNAMVSLQQRHHIQQLEHRQLQPLNWGQLRTRRTAQIIEMSRNAERLVGPRDYPSHPNLGLRLPVRDGTSR